MSTLRELGLRPIIAMAYPGRVDAPTKERPRLGNPCIFRAMERGSRAALPGCWQPPPVPLAGNFRTQPRARSLLREGVQGKAELWRAGRHIMAVDPLSGKWVKMDTTTGVIRTFFVPDEGYKYILRQIGKQGWVRFYV